MRRPLVALAALMCVGPCWAQTVGTAPVVAGGETTLATPAATPAPLPDLPLPAGAKVLALGHSYIDRAAGTSPLFPGVQVFARAVLPYVDALERADARQSGVEGRFDLDICYDDAGSKQVSSPSTRLSCADQGHNGDLLAPLGGVAAPGTLARSGYTLSRAPQIVYLDIGINDVRAHRSAEAITAMLDRQLQVLTSHGVWIVLQTLAYPRDEGNQPLYAATVPAVNAWILRQSGRPGVKVADTVALDGSPAAPLAHLAGDLLHLSPAGARARALVVWPLLQAMVAAATTPATGSLDPANLFPGKGLPGTGGTTTNASGAVATGFNLSRTTGASTYVGAKEAIASADEWQVVTVTPVANGTPVHSFGFKPLASPTYAALGLAAGNWYEFAVTIRLDDWPGWIVANGDVQTGALYAEASDGGLATQFAMYSNLAAMPGRTVRLTIKGRIPPGGDRFRWSNRMIQLFHRSDVAGTGVAWIGQPVLRKIADPRTPWGLP